MILDWVWKYWRCPLEAMEEPELSDTRAVRTAIFYSYFYIQLIQAQNGTWRSADRGIRIELALLTQHIISPSNSNIYKGHILQLLCNLQMRTWTFSYPDWQKSCGSLWLLQLCVQLAMLEKDREDLWFTFDKLFPSSFNHTSPII